MRIWIINQFANTPQMPGHTRQFEIASGLQKLGWKVSVFASDFNLSIRKFTKLKKFQLSLNENIEGIEWNWLRVTPYRRNNWLRYINIISFCVNLFIKLITKELQNIFLNCNTDFILVSSPQLPAAFITLIFTKLFKKNFIVEIRDLWPQTLIEIGGHSPNSIIIKTLLWMEKQVYSSANITIILSKGAESYVKERGAKKVYFLPNGADLDIFKYSKLVPEDKGFTKNRPFKILYSGAHGECNGLDNVIQAAELLRSENIQFIFLGDGPEKSNLIEQSRDLKNISFEPPIPKVGIPLIIKNADAIIISLRDKNVFQYGVSPNKLYDAYAIGRPVITTVNGYINNEVNEYNVGVTAPPEDPKLLAEAILKLYKLPREAREKMGMNSRKLAESVYSRDLIINRLDRILKAI